MGKKNPKKYYLFLRMMCFGFWMWAFCLPKVFCFYVCTIPTPLPHPSPRGGRKLCENGQKKKAMYLYMTSISTVYSVRQIESEQNRCAMAWQGCGAVFSFFQKQAVTGFSQDSIVKVRPKTNFKNGLKSHQPPMKILSFLGCFHKQFYFANAPPW